MGINNDTAAEQDIYAYIYTDRPIYRPGDTVFYKGIVRDTHFGRYTLPDIAQMEITINPGFFMGEESFSDSFDVTLDADGVFPTTCRWATTRSTSPATSGYRAARSPWPNIARRSSR